MDKMGEDEKWMAEIEGSQNIPPPLPMLFIYQYLIFL
jgi:hypothetical protein